MTKSLALVIALSTVAGTAQAANSILIKGTVPTTCTVDVVPSAEATALDIVAGGSKVVGQIKENCNFGGGYTIKASSASGSFLVNPTNTALKTAYTVSVQDGLATVALGTSATTVRTVGAIATPAVDLMKNLTVNVAANANAMGGDYEDTVTFTISAP